MLVAAGGLAAVFVAVLSGVRGHVADAVYTGVVGLLMVVAGLRMSASFGGGEGRS
jgi:hypothetical protein